MTFLSLRDGIQSTYLIMYVAVWVNYRFSGICMKAAFGDRQQTHTKVAGDMFVPPVDRSNTTKLR